ncbi:hypothetical protein [Actinacidiphila oryziradicis]|uniref:Uncharacterized protein n=1 Tax=Actinacidiphila oryziradicis TaxID=2571141 RepID=A0A4U0RJP8_9ACTN|nr:hypothetical protein [Actinacidiphila oryziradicis]TJZ95845.1 hypothetical protein FCI23_51700 [Actinacidiphila oryziradicis]
MPRKTRPSASRAKESSHSSSASTPGSAMTGMMIRSATFTTSEQHLPEITLYALRYTRRHDVYREAITRPWRALPAEGALL